MDANCLARNNKIIILRWPHTDYWTAAIKKFSMSALGLKGSTEGKLDSTAAFFKANFPGNVYDD